MSEDAKHKRDESFRDHVSTISKDGKRSWIYAKKPKGKYYNLRTIASIVFLVLFFALPFIRVNDEPLFLFNILQRHFILFGVTFWPQDFFIFGIGMITFILFVVLFTVIYGRVFCGWACPQSVFLEMVFRKIEYLIEGDANQQILLANKPYNAEKIIKKSLKHLVFFIISFIIANTFLAYVIGLDKLVQIVRDPVSQHLGGFVSLLLFTGVFYAVFSWFREQVCIIVCPYGRLQGVMTDKNTLLVAYDYLRGEPRMKFKKEAIKTSGDCIDCMQCVKVCPMGIDIRNGTQLECTNCTACIDACDFIMDKVGYEKGLIRFDSENAIANGEKFRFTPRILAYSAVLLLLLGVLATLLITRKDVNATILRTPGMLFQQQPNDQISNLYNIKLINKTNADIPITLKLKIDYGRIQMVGKNLIVSKKSKGESSFFIFLPKNRITSRKTVLQVEVYNGTKKLETVKTTFLGPMTLTK